VMARTNWKTRKTKRMYPPKDERSLSDWNMLCDSAAEIVILGYLVVQDLDSSGRGLVDSRITQLSIFQSSGTEAGRKEQSKEQDN
jgi:hypothetical protein